MSFATLQHLVAMATSHAELAQASNCRSFYFISAEVYGFTKLGM